MMAKMFKMQISLIKIYIITALVFLYWSSVECKKATTQNIIEDVLDAKDLKKLLRTRNNVLILYAKNTKEIKELLNLFTTVGEKIKGQATLAFVDCSGEAKKLCKKMKISPEPFQLKHYKDGEFHRDYERKYTVQSMVNFLKDPTGDLPWEEDDRAKDVMHISDANILTKLLSKEKAPIMVMFYAPWCGFCKRIKPEYEAAATELKGQAIMAAIDVNKPENSVIRQHFNITGFPTLLYFEGGEMKHKYAGENNKEGIISFMKSPENNNEKAKEEEWADVPSDVVHITDDTFSSILELESSVLIMFYAPWCTHCLKLKPEYIKAATLMKEKDVPGILAAVDATKQKLLAEKFNITGYPTMKYFRNGELATFDISLRSADKIVEFMKDPKQPPPPPPPETPWSAEESNVVHLTDSDFKPFLKRKKHVLVMFYAPWCGHCKKAKPEFTAAAEFFKDDPKVEFAAIDCQTYSVCHALNVNSYPTLKYFSYYNKVEKPYEIGRTKADFIAYMQSTMSGGPLPSTPAPPLPEQWWTELPNGEHVRYLKLDTFDKTIQSADSVLVMFYAPWCGHCKSLKPIFAEAAAKLKEKKVNSILAAVDATIETSLSSQYSIKAFPTVKYFQNGKFITDYEKERSVESIVSFMTNPPLAKEEL